MVHVGFFPKSCWHGNKFDQMFWLKCFTVSKGVYILTLPVQFGNICTRWKLFLFTLQILEAFLHLRCDSLHRLGFIAKNIDENQFTFSPYVVCQTRCVLISLFSHRLYYVEVWQYKCEFTMKLHDIFLLKCLLYLMNHFVSFFFDWVC